MRNHRRPAPVAALAVALGMAVAFPAPAAAGQEAAADARLAGLLEKAAEYCRKLEGATLEFSCLEKVEERTFRPPGIKPDAAYNMSGAAGGRMSYAYQSADTGYTTEMTYEYRFVRRDGAASEKRVLIDDNGIEKREEDARPDVLNLRPESGLFGPVGLLGEARQPHHDYKIVGQERRKGKTYVVVEAVPKPSLGGPPRSARVWFQEDDASVVRIAWYRKTPEGLGQVEALVAELDVEPDLVTTTEYDVVRNGLRFPGKDTTEEAYLPKKGKRFVKSRATTVYKDYAFSTVEAGPGR